MRLGLEEEEGREREGQRERKGQRRGIVRDSREEGKARKPQGGYDRQQTAHV